MFLLDKPQNYVVTKFVHSCAIYCVVGNKGFWSGASAQASVRFVAIHLK